MPGKTKAVGLRVSSACNQGGRKYMEDVINIVFDRREDSDYSCLAVFDGHGGRQAAVFARNYLWENIKMQRGFFSGDPPKVMAAIRKGFHVTQAAMEEVRSMYKCLVYFTFILVPNFPCKWVANCVFIHHFFRRRAAQINCAGLLQRCMYSMTAVSSSTMYHVQYTIL